MSSPNPFLFQERLHVLVTGGTGFIGTTLVRQMLDAGHAVTVLARKPARATALFGGKARCIGSLDALDASTASVAWDAVINLAGAPVVGPRWTPKRQRELLASRVGTTRALTDWLATAAHKPEVWIQASAIGFYGVREPAEALTEESLAGAGFMAELCAQWERAARPAADAGVRQVVLRLGVVWGPGGALPLMLLPIRLGMGGRLGSGRQVISWIQLDDVLRLIARSLRDPGMQGIYNAVAPEATSQAAFAATAGELLGRPIWLHLPARPIRWLAGEMAQLFVDGQRVVPQRLTEAGFKFEYPTVQSALRHLLS